MEIFMSMPLRIMLIIGSLMTSFFILRRIRLAKIQIEDSLFWIFLSGTLILLGIFPKVVFTLSRLLGIDSPTNLVFLVVIFLLIIEVFSLTLKISALQNKIIALAQRIALGSKNTSEQEAKKTGGVSSSLPGSPYDDADNAKVITKKENETYSIATMPNNQ